jgi:putative aldouronate transport system permease protein
LLHNLSTYKPYYLLMLPGILYFIIYKYIPMFGIIIAFEDYVPWYGFIKSQWVGLKNFEMFFKSEYFFRLIRNSFVISGLKIIFSFPAPFIFALLLNELRHDRFKKVVQTVSYLPHFFSWVILGGLMYNFFNLNYGIFPKIMARLGIEPFSVLMTPELFRPLLVISTIWKEMGWGAIVYLAALAGIDQQMYEAAIIDGANRWKQMLHITIPSIMPFFIMMFIIRLGKIIGNDFEQILILMNENGILFEVGDVFETFVYRCGIQQGNFSYATAVGLFQGIVGLLFVLGSNYIIKKMGYEGIW